MPFMSKEDLKETAWRWRCKVFHTTDERTLADYGGDSKGSSSSSSSEKAAAGVAAKPGTSKSAKPESKDAANSVGGALTVKTYYEGTSIGDGFYNWQDYPPRQQSKSGSKMQDRAAIKLYKIKDKTKPVIGGRFVMTFYQVEIQSPLLLAALAPILSEGQDYHIDPEETAVFNAPFRPLFFAYDAIVARLGILHPQTGPDDAALQPPLKLLVCVLDELFAEVRMKRKGLVERGLMSYELAWTYFPPNAVVLSRASNADVLSRVLTTTYVRNMATEALVVRVQVLRFNGEAFVWERQELKISAFSGNRPVVEFDHCPLVHLPADEQAELTTRLAERGRLVLDYQGLAYRWYTGVGMHLNDQGKMERHNVDGRILVDVVGYNKHHLAQGVREGNNQPPGTAIDGTGRTRRKEAHAAALAAAQRRAMGEMVAIDDGMPHDRKATAAAKAAAANASAQNTHRLSEEDQARNKAVMLEKPEELMFMSPVVEGYALKNKMWRKYRIVEGLSDSSERDREREPYANSRSLLLHRGHPSGQVERRRLRPLGVRRAAKGPGALVCREPWPHHVQGGGCHYRQGCVTYMSRGDMRINVVFKKKKKKKGGISLT